VTIHLKPDSLSFSLHGAAQAVAAVGRGVALPQALAQIFAQTHATPQARGAIQDLSYHCMRHIGRAEALLNAMTTKQTEPAILHGLLCCALALISDPNEAESEARYSAFTVVDQAVTAAAADPDMAHAKGMVNAVLRRFLRERDALLKSAGGTQFARFIIERDQFDVGSFQDVSAFTARCRAGIKYPHAVTQVQQRGRQLRRRILYRYQSFIEAGNLADRGRLR